MSAKPAPRRASLNWVDRIVATFNPQAGLERYQRRAVLARLDAISADPDLAALDRASDRSVRLRDNRTASQIVATGAAKARNAARNLVRNNEIAASIIDTRARNVLGPEGLKVEPLVKKLDGTEHTEFSDRLLGLWEDWQKKPEVTGVFSWPEVQEKAFTATDTDGECFAQVVIGNLLTLRHDTIVPMSLELIESDACPHDFSDPARKIEQGIECNDWGQPTGYYLYRQPPAGSDTYGLPLPTYDSLKRIDATNMIHVAHRARIHQRRGFSLLGSVVNRLDTIQSVEDAEMDAQALLSRITAQSTASLDSATGLPEELAGTGGPSTSGTYNADYGITPGTIVYNGPGEKMEAFKTEGQRAPVVALMDAFIRRACSATRVGYSSVSKNYNGTYSAQRQELVEQWPQYKRDRQRFADQFIRPVWKAFIEAGQLAGVIRLPALLDPKTLYDIRVEGPAMPWIKPTEEVDALKSRLRNGLMTHSQALRESGGASFNDVLAGRAAENTAFDEAGLRFDSDSRYPANGPTESVQSEPDDSGAAAPTTEKETA